MEKKQVLSLVGAGVAGVLLGFGGAALSLEPEQVPFEVVKEIEVLKEVPVPFEVVKEVEVPVEVVKEVMVDNGNLDLVMNFIFDRDGDVEFITDDLEADEVQAIADRIVFFDESVKLASDYIKKELADELDNKDYTFGNDTVEFDEDDFERVRIKDDLDEVEVVDSDFEDKDLQ